MQNALQATFVRRREFFLQLSVRRDDDDCYVVLLHSIPREQKGHTFARTPGTVEGRIVSMGFTVAPLKLRYRRTGSSAGGGVDKAAPAAGGGLSSPECLVTLVLSMDLGGWLGARTLLRYTLPFWSELQRGWVEALLMSLVALGNKVCFKPLPPSAPTFELRLVRSACVSYGGSCLHTLLLTTLTARAFLRAAE